MKSLNLGCGSDPWGDVRVDVAFRFITMRFKPTVLADAHYLPFKDGSFEVVKASHLLEHLMEPFKALDEILRVATMRIIVKFPTEWDVWPYFLCAIFPPCFSSLRWTIRTRKERLHIWVINPRVMIKYFEKKGWKCFCEKESASLFAFFGSGRKAKHFKWLTKRFRIPCEYIIQAEKRNF